MNALTRFTPFQNNLQRAAALIIGPALVCLQLGRALVTQPSPSHSTTPLSATGGKNYKTKTCQITCPSLLRGHKTEKTAPLLHCTGKKQTLFQPNHRGHSVITRSPTAFTHGILTVDLPQLTFGNRQSPKLGTTDSSKYWTLSSQLKAKVLKAPLGIAFINPKP